MITVFIFTSLHLNLVQAAAPYSTTYIYGDIGLKDASMKLKEIRKPDEMILAPADVCYTVGGKFYKIGNIIDHKLKENFKSDDLAMFVNSNKIIYCVLRKSGYHSILNLNELGICINKCFANIYENEGFIIYKINP